MILVFGGTTEGRKAVEVLEEAGSPFFYSTKTGEQNLVLHHGVRIDGAMDAEAMFDFCRAHGVRLLVDAAHPFAAQLHQTVASVASALELPAIRFERIFPERDSEIEWVDRIEDISFGEGSPRVLSTLGVQSISRLKEMREGRIRFVFRILPRESSIRLAHQQGASDDELCFYHEGDDEVKVMRRLEPDVLLVKESGVTGGFEEKVAAAKALGIRVVALRRPATPALFRCVNGSYGLRRMVEKLLPDFYALKSGLTTGTCATAAALAAVERLIKGTMDDEVKVRLPNGETIPVAVGYGDDYAFCIKDAGDDPDVTNGIEVRAAAEWRKSDSAKKENALVAQFDEPVAMKVYAGEGIGRFTLPGFDFPPGSPAVNRVPQQMIKDNLQQLVLSNVSLECHEERSAIDVVLTIPEGTSIARRTFNPRLGIKGGISVIGVSGIVKPFSEEAFLESIRKCLEVAKASGAERVVIGSGAKSENALKALYADLPPQAFVQYGNYVGATLQMAAEIGIGQVSLGVMLGKAVKLAAGQLDTHSRRGTFDRDFLSKLLAEAACSFEVDSITLVRELWEHLPASQLKSFVRIVISHCLNHCRPLLPNGELTIVLIDDNGQIFDENGEWVKI